MYYFPNLLGGNKTSSHLLHARGLRASPYKDLFARVEDEDISMVHGRPSHWNLLSICYVGKKIQHSKTYLCHNRPRPSRHFEKLGLVNVSLSLLQTRRHPPLLNDQAIWEDRFEPVLKKYNMINIDISTLKKKLTDSNPWASLCCTGRPPNRLSSSTACGGNRL